MFEPPFALAGLSIWQAVQPNAILKVVALLQVHLFLL